MMRNKGKKLICWLLTLALLLSIGAGVAYAEESETSVPQTVGAEEIGSDAAVAEAEETASEAEEIVTEITVITAEDSDADAEPAQDNDAPNTEEAPAPETAAAEEPAADFQPAETLDTHLTGEDSVYEAVLDNLVEALLGEAPHEHDGVTFTKWESATSLPTTAGSYYLAADVTIGSTWSVPGTTNLCLNGHGIRKTGSGSVISVSGGAKLNLYDCDTTTEHRFTVANPTVNGAGLATVDDTLTSGYQTFTGGYVTGGSSGSGGGVDVNGGTFTLSGGTVIGNTATYGGGVYVYNNGTFTLSGGTVSGNTANGSGGGVGAVGGTFIMIDGTITGNRLTQYSGGGVHVNSNGTFRMEGGTISANTAKANGGGVGVISGSFSMTGGTITGNTAEGIGNGVYVSDKFLMSGNVDITGNAKSGAVCNVYLPTGKTVTLAGTLTDGASVGVTMQSTTGAFTSGWSTAMGDAKPSEYFTSDNADYGVLLSGGEAAIGVVPHVHDEISFTAWNSTNSLPTAAGSYYLTADVTIGSRWDVPTGTVNLCLNGHSITRTGASGTTGSVIQVGSGATLNMYDCGTETRYYTVANPEANGAGLGTIVDESTYNAASETARGTFTGGYITGGNITGGADANHLIGGGVNVVSGTFTMNGGTIFGNRVCINGGGVKVKGAGASFTMNGGAILANYNDCYGGAISVGDNGSNRLCTVTINGGTIAHNWSGRNGGALHLDSYNHTFTITGGTIINNHTDGGFMNGTSYSAGRAGGGVLKDGVLLKLSGAPVFSANSNKDYPENNLNLMGGKTDLFDLSGHLTDGADIGVYVSGWSNPASADYRIATGAQMSDVQYIHYDIPSEATIVYCDGAKDWAYIDGAFVEYSGTHHTHAAGTVWATAAKPAAFVITGETTLTYATFADALSAWTDGTTLKLMKVVTTTATISVSGTKTLDLNGFNLTATTASESNRYCVIKVNDGAKLTVKGPGKITGGVNWSGGGIDVGSNGSTTSAEVILDGCEVSGNRGHYGGGLHTFANGTVTIKSGTVITGNTASDGFAGSGIYMDGGTLNMDGGTFTGNPVSGDGKYAVFLAGNATLHLQGTPLIYDNTYNGAQKNLFFYQSTDQDSKAYFSSALEEGTHIGVAQLNGAGVFTVGWSTAMGEADPADYFTSDNANYVVLRSGSEAAIGTPPAACVLDGNGAQTYAGPFADALSAWTDGSTLKLMKDVTTTATISVSSTKTLDLNGLGIKAGGTGYSVITVGSGADLTITDSAPDATDGANRPGGVTGGYITGGSVGQNYGGGVTVDGGVLRLTGGAITANANTYGGIGNCGGGVHVRSGGALYMTGGEISGNTSYVGGGVGTDTSATTVSVTGGVIQNNQTERFGSAIFAGRSGSAILRIAGDARIVGNISKWTGDKDGEGTVNSGSSVLLSGNPTVHGDWKTNGTSSPNTHINLDNDGSGIQRVELEGALTNETGTPNLTVTPLYRWNDLKSGKTFMFTRNWNTYMGAAHPADYFKVDDGVTGVRVIRKDGEAALTGSSDLGDLYVTFLANGGTGTMDPQLVTGTSATLNASTFTHSSFGFAGWNTDPEGKGTAYADKASVTLTGDLTLYAQWTDVIPEATPNATFTATGPDSGTLENVTSGTQYSLDGGTTWIAVTGSSVTISGITAEHGVRLYTTGNGTSTSDSDVQSITVTKAAKPSLTVTQPETADEAGSVSATAAYEYSADDGASWSDCEENQNLAAGSYRIRVKATGTSLASDAQIVTITKAISGAGESGTEYVVDGKTVKSELNVAGDSTPAVTVKNLDLEATEQSGEADAGAAVTLAMSVEAKPAQDVAASDSLIAIASEQSTLEYLEVHVSKTVGGDSQELTETQNVLEIVVPYSFKGKASVTVYRCHGGAAEALTEANTKADGTFRLDEENGKVYIYASKFSTYAIGYIQCYNLISSIQYGSFTGSIKLALLNTEKEPVMDLTESSWSYSFTHIPKGSYYLQATWTEAGVAHTLEKLIEIN